MVGARWLGLYILDEHGDSVPTSDYDVWRVWFEDVEKRRVALTEIDDVVVSTIFTGIDVMGTGTPLWETMVNAGDDWGHQVRYASRREAEAGHEVIVEMVRAGAIRAVGE